ncbi:putative thyroid transcription factor 1-associated protein 26 [Cocos nucifera]|uniref:Putative thyroid transcription factor 1-associated protein 26 n=1 Tax=Cocos nucifera TaxID=13894 RepID=A0A8K0HU98_COCNU|nr:putative thyroid transcription factor 1-associated protein 26 [Cocos nucifera]
MKSRQGEGGSERQTSASYKKNDWKAKRNERRLGGKGLSLGAFANAKSKPSGYNPSLIKKQKESYRNAKYVSKYKKLLKQQNHDGNILPTASEQEVGNDKEIIPKPSRNKKKKNSLQSLREEYEKKRAEDEKARMEREAIIQAKKEERAKAEARRKSLREKMFKKTRSGQPVMKYRIEHLLEVPLLGSSSSSSSSPTLEHEGNDEQEQVIIARALASLHQSQGNKLNFQNDRQRNRRRPAPIRKDVHPAANISFYPMPFQGWTYPSFSPEAAMYQMWQQAQASQQQAHLLTLPAPSHPINPRLIPTLRSVYQPTPGRFFPSVDQDSVSSVPCFTESAPVLPVYFSDYSVSVPPKSQSQVTIQEIQEEQNKGERKEWLNLPSEAAVFSSFDISDPNLPLDDAGPVPQVQEPPEDEEGNGSHGSTGVTPERETNNAPGLKPVVPTSNPSRIPDSTDVVKIQESQEVERSRRQPFEWVPGASIWPGPSTPNRPPNLQQNVNSFNPTHSALGDHHPSSRSSSSLLRGFRPLMAAPGAARTAVPVPIQSSGPRAEALRPRVPSLAAPVMIRTAVPVCSARPGAVNPGNEVPRASFMAPAIHVRSVVPVCSAPPSRKTDSGQRGTQEPEGIAAVNSEFAPIRKDVHPAANISFYPMPFQGWTYPSFSPEAAMYQMWQQAQASQQQAHLLTLPAPSHPINPRLIPTLRSVYQPTPGRFFPSVDQDSVSSVPCFTESAPVLPVYFSDYSVSVPPKSQSQVTIQEIQEEQNKGERKEWLNLPSEAAVFSSFDISDPNLPLDDAGPVPQVQEPPEDEEGNGSHGSTGVTPERETNNAPGLKPVVPTSNPSRIPDSTDVVKIQESQEVERSPNPSLLVE